MAKVKGRLCGNCDHCRSGCLETERCNECYFDKTKPHYTPKAGQQREQNSNLIDATVNDTTGGASASESSSNFPLGGFSIRKSVTFEPSDWI